MTNNYPLVYLTVSRFYNSHVLEPIDTFENVSRSLLGVQAQVENASAIAYSIRTVKPQYPSYLNLFSNMKLIRIWGFRTTLHSYCIDDWGMVLSQISSKENWFAKKMRKQGINIDQLVDQAVEILTKANSDTFDREYLLNSGIPKEYVGPWGDLLIELNNQGYICFAEKSPGRHKTFKNMIRCNNPQIGQIPELSDSIKREITTRYFSSYGPATVKDFSHWLGFRIKDATSYIEAAENNLRSIKCNGLTYLVAKNTRFIDQVDFLNYSSSHDCWLLPKFDPLLLAYEDKTWLVDKENISKVWKPAGHVDGVVVQDWRAIATWQYAIQNDTIKFTLNLFDAQQMDSINKCSLYERCTHIADFFNCYLGPVIIK